MTILNIYSYVQIIEKLDRVRLSNIVIIDVRGTTRFTNDRNINFGAQFDTLFQVNCGAAIFEKANMERNAGFGQIALKTLWLY